MKMYEAILTLQGCYDSDTFVAVIEANSKLIEEYAFAVGKIVKLGHQNLTYCSKECWGATVFRSAEKHGAVNQGRKAKKGILGIHIDCEGHWYRWIKQLKKILKPEPIYSCSH